MTQTLGLSSISDESAPTPEFAAIAAHGHLPHPGTEPSFIRCEPISKEFRRKSYLFKKLVKT